MNITELNRHLREAKGDAPADDRDRYFVKVSPRDYLMLYRQCHPKMDLPTFNIFLEQGYISIEPDIAMPDGITEVVID